MDGDEAVGPARHANGRFGPGNPGRRRGSRNLITRRLVMSILADFEQNEAWVLWRLREQHLAAYARLVARFLPKDEAAGAGFGETGFEGLGRAALAEARRRATEFHAAGQVNLASVEDWLLSEAGAARLIEGTRAALAEAGGEAGEPINGESTVYATQKSAANGDDTAPNGARTAAGDDPEALAAQE